MADDSGSWLREARGFTRNPLGIIGLFVVLIYGLAVVVAGFSQHLSEGQRWVMVAVVALFPPLVLAAFFRLVTQHHAKLYAPSDWKDERNFLTAAGQDSAEEKRDEEAREIIGAEAAEIPATAEEPSGQEVPHQVANRAEITKMLWEAERLALAWLETEYGQTIRKDVAIGAPGGKFRFDGVILDPETRIHTIFEIKLIRRRHAARSLLRSAAGTAARIASAVELHGRGVQFVLVLVTVDMDEEAREELANEAERTLAGIRLRSSVRVFDLDGLRSRVGRDEGEEGHSA